MSIGILLADDHAIVTEGLLSLLAQKPDLEVLASVSDGREAVLQSRRLQPQLVITDLSMPGLNGIEAARQIKQHQPDIKILCLSMHTDEQLIAAALAAGISGYVLKDCAAEELLRAIQVVLKGQTYLSPAITGIVVKGYRNGCPHPASAAFSLLTSREREIIQLIAEGSATKAIAERLCVSVKTVSTHRENAMRKLHIDSTAGLIKYAIRQGLTRID